MKATTTLAAIGLAVLAVLTPHRVMATTDLTIAAANSTCTAIRKAGDVFGRRHGIDIQYICKSSGRLAKGLMGGSITADVYISANKAWMDRMLDAGLIDPDRVRSLWGNDLVVAAPTDSPLRLDTFADLATPDIRTIMIGDPGTAPFGRYAKQSLEAAGLWETVRLRIVTRKHITLLANHLVAADNSTVGILFSTNLNPGLRTLVRIPANLHEAIRYYSGPLKERQARPLVATFRDFLDSEDARTAFRSEGFRIRP